ncbi:MAG: DUF3047 domain-containing protein [Desulfovibrionales bacterium]|nr:MAG: DUF3047 domain-containing protein [Desulfovibrionales bacterium]
MKNVTWLTFFYQNLAVVCASACPAWEDRPKVTNAKVAAERMQREFFQDRGPVFFTGLAVLCILFSLAVCSWSAELLVDDFEQGVRPEWEHRTFRNRSETRYEAVSVDGVMALRAESVSSASGYVMRIRIDPREYPVLEWRWKVENVLEKGDAGTKAGDDYPARVYVVFRDRGRLRSTVLNYIWANRLPQAEMIPSSYHRDAMMIAVRSGTDDVGQWKAERRDLRKDYRRAFGSEPPMIAAVAVMTDSDDTGEAAVAYYDFIRFLKAR